MLKKSNIVRYLMTNLQPCKIVNKGFDLFEELYRNKILKFNFEERNFI